MKTCVAVVLALLLLAVAPGAWAVWGGQEDLTHPGVGAMYYDDDGDGSVTSDTLICSGSYAGRSKDGQREVFLTAGHCMPPAEAGIPAGDLYVSFDRDGRNGVAAPIKVSSYHQMPGFGRDRGDLRDLGILLLPAGSATGLPAVQLPRAGYLDALMGAGDLKFMRVDLVGYGVIPVWDPPARRPLASTGSAAPAPRSSPDCRSRWCSITRTGTASAPARVCALAIPARLSSRRQHCSSFR